MSAVLRLGAAAALLWASIGAFAGDVRLISSVGMRGVMEQLKPEFERATAAKLVITFGTAVPLKRQIDEGAAFDVAVLTPALVADLAKSGKVDAQSVANVGARTQHPRTSAPRSRSSARCSPRNRWPIRRKGKAASPQSR
jgi:molybdate transport system substrate-binding protein